MEISLSTVLWILAVGVVVGLIAWLGPRPSQWRSHREDGEDDQRPDG